MTGSARNRVWYLLISAQNKATRLLPAFGQWRSRIGGQICRPFVLATSCVTSCYLRKERTNIRYRSAPTQNWRNTNKWTKSNRGAAKDPMILRIGTHCFVFIARKRIWNYDLNFHVHFKKTIFARLPPLTSAARCGPHPLATPLHSGLVCYVGWSCLELWEENALLDSLNVDEDSPVRDDGDDERQQETDDHEQNRVVVSRRAVPKTLLSLGVEPKSNWNWITVQRYGDYEGTEQRK